MHQSLLEQLPAIADRGRRQAERILDDLEGRRRTDLPTGERVPRLQNPRLGHGRAALAQPRTPHDAKDGATWKNRLIDGNGLPAMAALLAGGEDMPSLRGRIDMIYLDPPFSGKRLGNTGTGTDAAAGGPSMPADAWPGEAAAYLAEIVPRLVLMRELLHADGSIFVHMDRHVGYHAKLLLDDLFGRNNFRDEIVLPNQVEKYLQIRRDHLFWYTKNAAARFPPLWIQEHEGDGRGSRWEHFWDTADRPAMRYSLFGIVPTLGSWRWDEARALKAIRNYERFREEGSGRTIEKYWCDTGATFEFLRPSPGEGVPQHWRQPAGVACGQAAGPEARGHLAGCNEAYLAQIIGFATAEQGIVAGFGGGAAPVAPVAEKLGRRWLVAGLDESACTIVRKRLTDRSARPFLYQRVDGGQAGMADHGTVRS
ncbi:MAG: DNA methyltransferase [Rhodanobacter sp.]